MVIDSADHWNQGYSIESVGGTDPLTTRLALPGEVITFEPRYHYDKKIRYGPHSRDPKGSYAVYFDTTLHIELLPYDEFNAGLNSMIALAIGSAPNAGTGVVTNQNDLRSFTVQYGLDKATPDEWRRIRYCVIDTYEVTIAEKEPVKVNMDILGISHPTNDHLTSDTPWAAVPSDYDGAPWASTGHVTWTMSGQTFSGDVVGGKFGFKNHCGKINALNQTGITATKTYTGGRRETAGSFEFTPDDWSDFNIFKKDPGNPANRFDQTINFSKDWNQDATLEGLNLSIPGCVQTPDASTSHRFDSAQTDANTNSWSWIHAGPTAVSLRCKP